MNFAKARVAGDRLTFADGNALPMSAITMGKASALEGQEFIVGVRPEHFGPTNGSGIELSVQVQVVEPLGSDTLVHFNVGGEVLTARMPPHLRPQPDSNLTIGLDPSKLHLLDVASERSIH